MYHVFQPIVTLTERDDGRYDMKCDWSSSLTHSGDNTGEDYALDGPGQPGDLAAEALNFWLKSQPSTFVLYPGIMREEQYLLIREPDDFAGPEWERARKLIRDMGGTLVGAFSSGAHYPFCGDTCWGPVSDDPHDIDKTCAHPIYAAYGLVRWSE